MLLDTLMAIIITGSIGSTTGATFTSYITPDLTFTESISLSGETVYILRDFKKMKFYRLEDDEFKVAPIVLKEPGEERGWKVVGRDIVSRQRIDTAQFLECECIVSEEVHESPDIFQPESGKKNRFTYRFYACKIPELEALSLQTKLHLHFYKDWKWPEYPFELRQWAVSEENDVTILNTISSVDKGPFPIERVKALFPEWEKDININRLKQAAIELKAFLDQLVVEGYDAAEIERLMEEKIASDINYSRIISGVFPEDWQDIVSSLPPPKASSERTIEGVSFNQLPTYIQRVITEGGDNNFLIVTLDEEKNYYVQLWADKRKGVLILEAVSNNYLVTEMQLPEEQMVILRQQGFDLPDHPESNFKLEFPHDLEIVGSLIQKIGKIAVEVYGVTEIEKKDLELLLVLE
ncbi:MAG: hypothetical protein R2824_35455 [Saprospiraceae bacterium]|nr:hypothetical protein [Lewinella sp.]